MLGSGFGSIDDFLRKNNLGRYTEKVESETLIKQKVEDLKQDRVERKKYALWTFIFLCIFTGIILLIIIFSGFSQVLPFSVSENVLMTLITTSLATVVSIFIFVMKYLFNK